MIGMDNVSWEGWCIFLLLPKGGRSAHRISNKAEKVDNVILALTYEVFTLSELSRIIESMMVLIMVMVILQYNNYNKEETLQW